MTSGLYWQMSTAALTLLARSKKERLRELREQGESCTARRPEVEILEKQLGRIYEVIRSREEKK
jgi:hypothetical protein